MSEPRICPLCDGIGMRIVERADGGRLAETCACQQKRMVEARLKKVGIPLRYEDCSFDSFDYKKADKEETDPDLYKAFNHARHFAETFPGNREGPGLLFTGSVGTGKTHLATSILRTLSLDYGVFCVFCDYLELLRSIRHSYNKSVDVTELDVLRPVLQAEVLVLDELGAAKVSDWVEDTVSLILNTRYKDKRVTIITTNYPNRRSAGGSVAFSRVSSNFKAPKHILPNDLSDTGAMNEAAAQAQRVMREETLGDRIGERMWSRLQEMCVPVEIKGPDYRLGAKRARFA